MGSVGSVQALQMHSATLRQAQGKLTQGKDKDLGYWAKETSERSTDFKNLFWKPIYHVVDWVKMYNPSLSPSFVNLGAASKDTKNGFGLAELPHRLYTFANTVWTVLTGNAKEKTEEVARKVLVDGAGIVNPLCDLTHFAVSRNIIALGGQAMKAVGSWNAGALGVVSINGIYSERNNILASEAHIAKMTNKGTKKGDQKKIDLENQRISLSMINIAKWTSYVGLSSLALTANFLGMVFAPWTFLACSTSALVFTIGGFFYGKQHDLKG